MVAAFLNGIPKETIYLPIPQGFNIPGRTERTVLKVNKSIYGLKQSPRCWYDKLHLFLISINFGASTTNPCLFISQDKSLPCYVHVHFNDMTIAGTKISIQSFKTLISKRFEMEDLGEVIAPGKFLIAIVFLSFYITIVVHSDSYHSLPPLPPAN